MKHIRCLNGSILGEQSVFRLLARFFSSAMLNKSDEAAREQVPLPSCPCGGQSVLGQKRRLIGLRRMHKSQTKVVIDRMGVSHIMECGQADVSNSCLRKC